MTQTLLITGATGYLGSHLVRTLVDAGHRVAILKRASSSLKRLEPYIPRLAMFNIEDGLDLPFKSLGHVDTVIHAATCYGRAGEKASEVFEANTAFPLRLLETATFFNTDTILYKYLNSYSLSKQHLIPDSLRLSRMWEAKLPKLSRVETQLCWVNSFIVNPTHRSTKCWVAKSATQPTDFGVNL